MDKQEIIDSLNLIKQRVNEGSKGVRDQRDKTLPLVAVDEQSTGMLNGAIQFYNESCRDTKKKIDKIIEIYVPSPIIKLPLELSYPKLKIDNHHIGVCTCLIPSLLFNHAINDADFIRFLNWFCELEAGNQIRGMAWGGWEPHTWDWLLQPYDKQGDKYQLEDYNEDFFAMVDRRLAMMRERHITAVISMNDHCSLKPNPPGYWKWSWWNGNNNVNGTAILWAGMYHHYEEQHQDKKDWVKLGEYLMRFYNRMFEICAKYWPFTVIEFGNEVRASQSWHQLLWNALQPYKPEGWDHFPKFSVQSSVNNEDIGWLRTKRIEEVCQMSIHGCCDEPMALQRVKDFGKAGVRYILSQDGCEPTPSPEGTRTMTRDVLSAGHDVEFNFRPLHEYHREWKNVCGKEDWSLQKMMTTSEPWFEAASEGWLEYIGQNI